MNWLVIAFIAITVALLIGVIVATLIFGLGSLSQRRQQAQRNRVQADDTRGAAFGDLCSTSATHPSQGTDGRPSHRV